jgi:hypothetical protein
MNNVDALRISQYRDGIYEWACDRFKELIAEDRVDDAVAFADEFYEWLDPEQLDEEVTLFYDENELQQYYEELQRG